MPNTRRAFLGGAASLTGFGRARATAALNDTSDPKLGVATYSLRQFSRTQAIEMIRKLNTPYVNVKEFHLPYSSTHEELARGRK